MTRLAASLWPKETPTGYYVNDLTCSQSQGGVTNTYELGASLRQRERITTGGSEEGTAIYHYAGGSDSPAWTEEGEDWTRNIGALGGGLGAIETSSGEVTLQLANMHGECRLHGRRRSRSANVLSTQRFDEFGNPLQSGALLGGDPEYGWLGGKGRRTQLASGVVQMGARSYVPALGRFSHLIRWKVGRRTRTTMPTKTPSTDSIWKGPARRRKHVESRRGLQREW